MVNTSTFLKSEKLRTVLVKFTLVIRHTLQIHEPNWSGCLERIRPLLGTGLWVAAQHHCRAGENSAHGQMPPSCSRAAPELHLRPQARAIWRAGLLLFLTQSSAGATSTRGLWFTPCQKQREGEAVLSPSSTFSPTCTLALSGLQEGQITRHLVNLQLFCLEARQTSPSWCHPSALNCLFSKQEPRWPHFYKERLRDYQRLD